MLLVLTMLMALPEGVLAQGASMSGAGMCLNAGVFGQGNGILPARKKKKKKKKNKDKQSQQNQQSDPFRDFWDILTDTNTDTNSTADSKANADPGAAGAGLSVTEDGTYTSKEEVALYIHLYGHLPDNYITKREAEELGWVNREGNLWDVAPGKSIGGSRFGNYEGALPEKDGRTYRECDIDFDGGYRNEKRIVYSDDGLIYYTEDHYTTFERLY